MLVCTPALRVDLGTAAWDDSPPAPERGRATVHARQPRQDQLAASISGVKAILMLLPYSRDWHAAGTQELSFRIPKAQPLLALKTQMPHDPKVVRQNERMRNGLPSGSHALDFQASAGWTAELFTGFQAEHREVQGAGDALALLIDVAVDQPALAVWTGMGHLVPLVVDLNGEGAGAMELR